MFGYLRRHHIALLALFLALGGTSYAAVELPTASVGTRQIRAGAVTFGKLSASLRHSVVARRGPRGSTGPRGQTGPTGPRGATGLTGPAGAGTARAFGYYQAGSSGCAPTQTTACPQYIVAPSLNATNATLGSPNASAPTGTVCIIPAASIDATTAVVVATPTGGAAQNGVDWIRGAPDCASGALELQTSVTTVSGSTVSSTGSSSISFSFVVP